MTPDLIYDHNISFFLSGKLEGGGESNKHVHFLLAGIKRDIGAHYC